MNKLEVLLEKIKICQIQLWLYEKIYFDSDEIVNDVKKALSDLLETVIMIIDHLNEIEDERLKNLAIDLSDITEIDFNKSKEIIAYALVNIVKVDPCINNQCLIEVLENEVRKVTSLIKNCKEFEDSLRYFQFLERIQTVLVTLLFKCNVNVSNYLNEFVHKFERIDVQTVQKNIYKEIKSK